MADQMPQGQKKRPVRLIMSVLGMASILAALPATGAVAADRDAAALFARVCLSDAPAFKRVQAKARSEGWMDAPAQRGRAKPPRLDAWLVPVGGKVGFAVSVSTVKMAGRSIEQCTAGGPASRQAVRAMLRSAKAEEQPSMTGAMVPGGIDGNPQVYTAQMGGHLAYITTETAGTAYVLSITVPRK
ncbi:MAG TPA: hypothetical protein PK286_12755 [Devosia sp.]|nr:hypothetical protein [Devosia sp.]